MDPTNAPAPDAFVPDSPPQAEGPSRLIAKQLGLSDETIDRYGDVLGIRAWDVKDGLRDAAMAMLSGDPAAPQKQAARMQETVNERKNQAIQQAMAAKKEDRLQLAGFVENYRKLFDPNFPPQHRVPFLKSLFRQQGIEVPPEIVKALADEEVANAGMLDFIQNLAGKAGMKELAPFLTDPRTAPDWLTKALALRKQNQDHDNAVLEATGKGLDNQKKQQDLVLDGSLKKLDQVIKAQTIAQNKLEMQLQDQTKGLNKIERKRRIEQLRKDRQSSPGPELLRALGLELQARRNGQPPGTVVPGLAGKTNDEINKYLDDLLIKETTRPEGGGDPFGLGGAGAVLGGGVGGGGATPPLAPPTGGVRRFTRNPDGSLTPVQ